MEPIPLRIEAAHSPAGPACLLPFKHPLRSPSALPMHVLLLLYSTGNCNPTRGGGKEAGQVESLMRALAFSQVQTESKSNPFSLCLTSEVMFKKLARSLGNRMSSAWSDIWWVRRALRHLGTLSLFPPRRVPSATAGESPGCFEKTNCQHSGAVHQMHPTCKPSMKNWYPPSIRAPVHSLESPDTPSFKQGLGRLEHRYRCMLCPTCTEWSWAHICEA